MFVIANQVFEPVFGERCQAWHRRIDRFAHDYIEVTPLTPALVSKADGVKSPNEPWRSTPKISERFLRVAASVSRAMSESTVVPASPRVPS